MVTASSRFGSVFFSLLFVTSLNFFLMVLVCDKDANEYRFVRAFGRSHACWTVRAQFGNICGVGRA